MNLMLHIGDQTYNKGQDDRNFELQKWINELNATLVRETNQTNLDIARETNASNVEQANLAYERSLPVNQVFDMMNAGMSKAGALSKLAGGGQYTAPAMQMATMQAPHYDTPQHNYRQDSSNLMKALSRLGDLPANVMQEKQSKLHIQTIKQQIDLARRDELRKQEEHEFNMWEKLHGKKAVEMIDSLASTIVSEADSRGVNLDDIDSVDKLIKAFDLNNNKDWLNMPHSARSQIMEAVHTQHAINLQNKEEQRESEMHTYNLQDARDRHTKALDDLKNSEFARTHTHFQIEKLKADTQDVYNRIDEYEASSDAREKERLARECEADFKRMMAQFGISEHEFKNSQWWTRDKDGKIVPTGIAMQKQGIADAWKFAGTFFGADMLQDILRGIVTIAK